MATTRGIPLLYLRTWREWRGVSQETLAQQSGVGATTIIRIEGGARARFATIDKLASALLITRDQLLHSQPEEAKLQEAA